MKKGDPMAKKKRKKPTRQCEKCKGAYHPRMKVCTKCGAGNPTSGGKRKKVEKTTAAKPSFKAEAEAVAAMLEVGKVVTFAKDLGGIDNAIAALEKLKTFQVE